MASTTPQNNEENRDSGVIVVSQQMNAEHGDMFQTIKETLDAVQRTT